MSVGVKRIAFVTSACLLWLTACETTVDHACPNFSAASPPQPPSDAADAGRPGDRPAPLPTPATPPAAGPGRAAADGRRSQRRSQRRQAVLSARATMAWPNAISAAPSRPARATPRPGSDWPPPTTGSSASTSPTAPMTSCCSIVGPTPEVLNNQGFSFILRGDYGRARANSAGRPGERSGQPLYQEQYRPAREERAHPQGRR